MCLMLQWIENGDIDQVDGLIFYIIATTLYCSATSMSLSNENTMST